MQTTTRLFSLCLLILGFYSCQPTPEKKQPVDWVNPQIGSVHCRWFFYTPAALPMGMAKLAPTTNAYGSYGSWLPCGYDDRHTSIEGFAHFHEFQIGGVVTIPTTGELKTLPGTLEDPDSGYRSRGDRNIHSRLLRRNSHGLQYQSRNHGNHPDGFAPLYLSPIRHVKNTV